MRDFVARQMREDGKIKTYNENTVGKDIGVLLQNYVLPKTEILSQKVCLKSVFFRVMSQS